MEMKLLEVRDEGTFISVVAIKMQSSVATEAALLRREGYPDDGSAVMVTYLCGERPASADMYFWPNRTMANAHFYIWSHFDTLKSGDVVDVQYILGETKSPKASEVQSQEVSPDA